jgi:hypothetical protein
MASGRWGSDEERWDAELYYGPDEELEHELALAAALDRSRTDLSPDPEAADRMRGDFFARLEQEWSAPEHETERTAVIPPIPPVELGATDVIPAAQDAPEPEPAVAEVVSMVGRKGRKRHNLPANHPENPRRPKTGRRVALVGAAAAAGLVALVGGTAAMSQGALPGDSLYSMKLMSESTGSAFTFGDAAQAQRHLDIAATRLAEIESLQQAGRAPDAATYQAALSAFDAAASEGSRMVLAGPDPTEAGLGDLGAWAQRQSDTLAALRAANAQAPGTADSARLMERVAERSAALQARMGCTEVSDGVDDLGPIPARGTCVPSATGQGSSGSAVHAGPSGSSSARGGVTEGTATPESATTETTAPTDTTTPQQDGGLLDPLLGGEESATTSTTPGSSSATTSNGSSGGSSSTDQQRGGGGGGLLPPINLPPLLPGLPSITLG